MGGKLKRTCVACRIRKEKYEFTRVIRTKNNSMEVDSEFKKTGRGAYICNNVLCIERAKKFHAFERALKCNNFNDEFWQKLGEIPKFANMV